MYVYSTNTSRATLIAYWRRTSLKKNGQKRHLISILELCVFFPSFRESRKILKKNRKIQSIGCYCLCCFQKINFYYFLKKQMRKNKRERQEKGRKRPRTSKTGLRGLLLFPCLFYYLRRALFFFLVFYVYISLFLRSERRPKVISICIGRCST